MPPRTRVQKSIDEESRVPLADLSLRPVVAYSVPNPAGTSFVVPISPTDALPTDTSHRGIAALI